MSNIKHLRRQFLTGRDTSTRILSMCQHLDTVLFYTWFGEYTAAMPRKLVWIEGQTFEGFGCSECSWVFETSTALVAESLDEMKQKYEAQRDNEFAAHVCVKPPRASRPKTE
jgi:hypothetical protein